MKTPGQYESEAIAASHRLSMVVFYRKRNGIYEIFRRVPGNRVVLVKKTKSPAILARFMIAQEMPVRKNPDPRAASAAESLATRFHGRKPTVREVSKIDKPKIPDAMTCIGDIFAIEYVAERDGKKYRFRHAFKAASRPYLAVSPDGKIATMIGGSWFFGEDGFEDLKP